MAPNIPSSIKERNVKLQNAKQQPSKINTKKTTSRSIIIKLLKTKDKVRILKAAREKQHI